MKPRKHITPERDFGFVPDTFKLFGEVVKQGDVPRLQAKDTTLELFVDHAEVTRGREVLRADLS